MNSVVSRTVAVVLVVASVGGAKAGLLVGPDFSLSSPYTAVGGNDANGWGIQFTAVQDSILKSFDYVHRTANFGNPFSGSLALIDVTNGNTTLYSTTYGPLPANSNPALSVLSVTGLNIHLKAGDVYQLVAKSDFLFNTYDEIFQYSTASTFTFPVANADISVTQGVFGNNPGWQEQNAWAAFRNLATDPVPPPPSPVPEPTSLVLLGSGLLGAWSLARARRRRR